MSCAVFIDRKDFQRLRWSSGPDIGMQHIPDFTPRWSELEAAEVDIEAIRQESEGVALEQLGRRVRFAGPGWSAHKVGMMDRTAEGPCESFKGRSLNAVDQYVVCSRVSDPTHIRYGVIGLTID